MELVYNKVFNTLVLPLDYLFVRLLIANSQQASPFI